MRRSLFLLLLSGILLVWDYMRGLRWGKINNGGTGICTSSVLTLNTPGSGTLHHHRHGNSSSAGITVMAGVIVHQTVAPRSASRLPLTGRKT